MARIRSVHPDLCVSETMAAVSARAERTFVRLWTHCDDEGRCRDDSRLLRAALYPLHDDVAPADVDDDLDELAAEGVDLVVRYEVDGKRFVAVRSWGEFQHPQRPTKSKLPEPSASNQRPRRDTSSTRHVRESSASLPRGLNAGVEWSGEGDEEGVERDASETRPTNNDSLTDRALDHFKRTMGSRFDEAEVRKVIDVARANHLEGEIQTALMRCSWPSELQRTLPATKPEPLRPTSPEPPRCTRCNDLVIQDQCACWPDQPTITAAEEIHA